MFVMYIHANINILVLTKGNSSFLPVELQYHTLCLLLKLYIGKIAILIGNTLQSVFFCYTEQM